MDVFQPNELKIADAISTLYREIIELGAHDVVVANEVSDFEIAVSQVGKTNLVGEYFKRSLNTLPPSHVMWAGIYDQTGCVCTVAAQHQDVQGRSLQRHVKEFMERTFEDEEGNFVSMKPESLSFAGLLDGPFVYVGEGFVKREARGKNYLGLLQRMLILSSYVRWRPKLVYGFMTPQMIRKKYHVNWGYSIARPTGFIWNSQPKNPDWRNPHLVSLSGEGVCRLVEDPLLAGLSRHHENSKKDTADRTSSETEARAADTLNGQEAHLHSLSQ